MRGILFSIFLFPVCGFSSFFNDDIYFETLPKEKDNFEIENLPGNNHHFRLEHIDKLIKCLEDVDTEKGFEILQRWQIECPEDTPYINGMFSVLYLMDGQVDKSKFIMQKACAQLSQINFPKDLLYTLIDLFISLPNDKIYINHQGANPSFEGIIKLCKKKQPKGVKLKFWIGVAQVAGGCLAMPFNPVAGGALIGAGASCVIDATSESLNNKDQWEKELNDRQRNTIETSSTKSTTNSFCYSRFSIFQLYVC